MVRIMKRKRIFLYLVVSITLIVFLLSGVILNKTQSTAKIENEKEDFYMTFLQNRPDPFIQRLYDENFKGYTLSDFVAPSTHCVIGEYKGFTEVNSGLWEFKFEPIEKIYGRESDDIIRIRIQNSGFGTGDGGVTIDTFKNSHRYILILERTETLFLEYPYYSLSGALILDVDNLEKSTWYEGDIVMPNGTTAADIIEQINTVVKEVGHTDCFEHKIFRTEDTENVINNCDAIFRITVKGVISQGVYDYRTVYRCTVSEVLKGNLTTNEKEYVYIVTERDKLLPKSEYIMSLSYTAAGTFYHQASPICIFDASDTEMETQIKEWLSEKKVP